jgi:adenine deaminase
MPIVRLQNRSRLWEVFPELISVGRGLSKADLVIKNVNLIDVFTRDILEGFSIAVKGDRIAYVGRDIDNKVGSDTLIIDGDGCYLAPGFMDAHLHIESSMLTLSRYAEVVVPRGVTGLFIDPHEIANVLGIDGIKMFIEESAVIPLKVFITLPSCVPSAPGLETCGAIISPEDIRLMLDWEGVIALGEMMNFPGVLALDDDVISKIRFTLERGYVVEGHAPSLDYDELSSYVAGGITSCHESTSASEAIRKLILGMYVMVRLSSASKDIDSILPDILSRKLDTRHVILVSDDREVDDLVGYGGVDYVVRRAIELGLDPIDAIRMVTLNVAEHYEVSRELGGIAPGRFADMVLIDDLEGLSIHMVISDGVIRAVDGVLRSGVGQFDYPEYVLHSIRFKTPISPERFYIKANIPSGVAQCNVIGLSDTIITSHLIEELVIDDYVVRPDVDKDILYVSVLERHGKTGSIGKGFVKGFGLGRGAIASSVAHDSHNVVVVGVDPRDMYIAAKTLEEVGGGYIAVMDGEVIGLVRLPVAGLMSMDDPYVVADEVSRLEEAFSRLGCSIEKPHMKLCFLSLAVIPELRITDKGLVLVRDARIIDVVNKYL